MRSRYYHFVFRISTEPRVASGDGPRALWRTNLGSEIPDAANGKVEMAEIGKLKLENRNRKLENRQSQITNHQSQIGNPH